jgi:hypothetical protein
MYYPDKFSTAQVTNYSCSNFIREDPGTGGLSNLAISSSEDVVKYPQYEMKPE